jgi:hypothetical protein
MIEVRGSGSRSINATSDSAADAEARHDRDAPSSRRTDARQRPLHQGRHPVADGVLAALRQATRRPRGSAP